MKICLATPEFPPRIGGLGHSVDRIANSIKNFTEHEVHVVTFDNMWNKSEQFSDVQYGIKSYLEDSPFVHRICFSHTEKEHISFSIYNYLRKLYNQLQFDIFVSFGATSYLGFPMTFLAKERNVPAIVSLRGKDIHTDIFLRDRFGHIFWTLTNANKVVAVSHDILNKAMIVSKQKERATVIPNHINPSKFEDGTAELFPLDRKKFIIAACGIFRATKGVRVLLEAASYLHGLDFCLLLVGDARPHERELFKSDLSTYTKMFDVVVTGFVDHKDILRYLRLADIFVLPSILDGAPNVLLEAMLTPLPIIATSVGSVPDIIENEVNGIVVEPESSAQLSAAIMKLANDSRLCSSLAQSALKTVLLHLSPGHEARAWNLVFESLK